MDPEPFGPNVIEVSGTAMLLTTTGGGVAIHLTASAETAAAGQEAVADFYFDEEADGTHGLAGYDRHALTEPRWSEKTLCGREWAVMVGGDGGAIGRFGEVAFAPTCRRCLTILDRHFPTPVADDRLVLVAQLAADVVIDQRGFAEIHHVPGDQQDTLRKTIRAAIRRRINQPVRTYSINSVIYVECKAMYDQHARRNDHEAAEAIDAVLKGEPSPHRERDWIISWETWGVA
ncbi:hypothetical protein [Catenuloplanes japonicus]|uniref:hypothetical protein n=1 Tax=Catenuloplanes japonicus TaxID=33876 RepID=UPI000526CDB0|nr:hypothetical protein [Catenuloplanes japonicus]